MPCLRNHHPCLLYTSYTLKEAVRTEINRLLKDDIIECSQSPYTSPIVAIRKKDGMVRLCLDAREINKTLINDRTSAGEIEEILKKFHDQSLLVPGTQFAGTGRWNYTQTAEGTWRSYLKDAVTNLSDYLSD